MNTSHNDDVFEPAEDRVDAFLRKSRECVGDQVALYEQRISDSPAKAVLIAAGIGYVAHSLPLAAMLSVPIRLAARLAPPLLLALGATKAFEMIRNSSGSHTQGDEEEPLLDLFPRRAAGQD